MRNVPPGIQIIPPSCEGWGAARSLGLATASLSSINYLAGASSSRRAGPSIGNAPEFGRRSTLRRPSETPIGVTGCGTGAQGCWAGAVLIGYRQATVNSELAAGALWFCMPEQKL